MPPVSPNHSHPPSCEQIAHELGLWCEAHHWVERQVGADWRADSEQAITAGLAFVRRSTTMQGLVRWYVDDLTDGTAATPLSKPS